MEMKYRLSVFSRAVAAIGGGYVVAALSTALLASLLPMAPADAVMSATMLSFAVYTCAVIWVFAARTAWHAWIGLVMPGVLLGFGLLASRGAA
ncbi:MAG TPA: DUF3649 domain-containing protein [Oxalicibacterium sp.]|nr:DUF3649 domain-containing protein [Oxalicibacterium sp.]HWU98500.1 DUF3649 domain-containing protein [Oxalicibacterium sp.]